MGNKITMKTFVVSRSGGLVLVVMPPRVLGKRLL